MAESYFDDELLLKNIERLKNKGDAPEWLYRVVMELSESIESFTREEEDEPRMKEFVYPH